MKQTTRSQFLSHQEAPKLLFRFPRLLFVYFLLNHFSALRMQYARRAIRRSIRTDGVAKKVVDAGCGMGDYLFTVPEFTKADLLLGIDISQSNIDLCHHLASTVGRHNMEFLCSDLASAEYPESVDLILCIGVLMYVQDDITVLRKFHDSLRPNGTLLLYAAVNYRRTLPFYKRLEKHPLFDYDMIIGRPHTYTDATLKHRLSECGFTIQEQCHSFGPVAAIMFEISALFEWYFKSLHPIASIALLPFYLIFYPLYLVSMIIDVHTSRSTGNGVMITAKKIKE